MQSKQIMKDHGRTFFWSSAFLPREEAEDIYALYAFCRYVDDLVDVKGLSCQQIIRDLEIHQSEILPVQRLLLIATKRKMSLEPARILVNTLEEDRSGQTMKNWRTLLRYCYGVASTVGLMMCEILGIKNPQAYAFAIDLGIAMQLTNIARDVYEDALHNRIYLPSSAFSFSNCPENILCHKNLPEILKVREEVLKLADRYYASANRGMHFLPRGSRLAIMIASRLYQAKGKTIRKDPLKYFKHRADVSFLGKVRHSLGALSFFCSDSLFSPSDRTHDLSLHAELENLPSIDFSKL